ncbi:MAG: S9 family peptidase [Deltaproteobacteria bacterium]|nr:S9 family peptidase [Deltaproteobacteria bacterium]
MPGLIPRDVLFGNPERTRARLSPDGKRLAWIAPDQKNVLQVWVQTIGKPDEKVVTADKKRGIRQYLWAEDSRTILYMQDADGDENHHVYAVGVAKGAEAVRDLTPWQGVKAGIVDVSPRFPTRILIQMNLRDRRLFDMYRVDVRTGAVEIDTQNPGDVAGWVVDDNQAVRGAVTVTPDGGREIRVRPSAKAPWKTLLKVGPEENLDPIDFSKDGRSLYLKTSVGSDTARVVLRHLATGKETLVAKSDAVDAGDVVVHPTRHVVQAVGFARGRNVWTVVDPTVKADFEAIAALSDGDFRIANRDTADKVWLVYFVRDRGAVRYFTWDRASKKGEFLFAHQPRLEKFTLADMKPIDIKARDGLVLNSYLTLPPGVPPRSLPLVVYVHGGPWNRDSWGFDPTAQWLANRGYAVLQVNFRGSDGFGKKFLHAGDRQWGFAMQDDLHDAIGWAVKEGLADPKRVGILGGSYGGYAALAGAAFTPDAFRCAVDIVGPSNLFTLLQSIPPYWKPMVAMFHQRMGDPEDPQDRELLKRASPLFSARRIKIPLLIGQGANDPRVKQAESEQIVAAIEKNRGQAVYVLYSDEGHGFARPENRIDFFARTEAFLAEHLGGRAELLEGKKIKGSTAVVRVVGGKR